jgi:hypothetical protein
MGSAVFHPRASSEGCASLKTPGVATSGFTISGARLQWATSREIASTSAPGRQTDPRQSVVREEFPVPPHQGLSSTLPPCDISKNDNETRYAVFFPFDLGKRHENIQPAVIFAGAFGFKLADLHSATRPAKGPTNLIAMLRDNEAEERGSLHLSGIPAEEFCRGRIPAQTLPPGRQSDDRVVGGCQQRRKI